MYRRFFGKPAATLTLTAVAALSLGGCVQATRHSNTMIFGTNTTVGFKVGQNVSQVPEIVLAYDRQELVIMPLVANTVDNGEWQTPCDVSTGLAAMEPNQDIIHPCLLVAINGSASDSYSVLASFGADFEGSTGTSTRSKAGIGQYFATGVAAQVLAFRGGAALVATGEAANNSNYASLDNTTVQALFNNPAATQRGIERGTQFNAFRRALINKVDATESGLQDKVKAFEGSAGLPDGSISASCLQRGDCLKAISESVVLAAAFSADPARLNAALSGWKAD
jgi:hypothetical protein